MQLFCGGYIRGMGIFRGFEITKMMPNFISNNFRSPFFSVFVPKNTLKPTSIVNPQAAVKHILSMRYNSQIVSFVVEPISVNMIYKKTIWGWENNAMHKECPPIWAWLVGHCIICSTSRLYTPIAILNQVNAINVYNRFISFCKRNICSVAINSDRAYKSFHLAAPIRWCERVERWCAPRLNLISPQTYGVNE